MSNINVETERMDETIQTNEHKSSAALANVWPVIFRFMKPYGLAIVVLLIFIAADAVFDWGLAFVQGFFVDSINQGGQAQLNDAAILVVGLLIGFIVLLAMHRYVIVWLKESLYRDMSMDLLTLLNQMPYAWVRRQKSGDIMLRIKEDTKHGAEVVEAIAEGVTVVFIIVLSLGYLYRADPWIAVIALVSAAAIWLTARLYDQRIVRLSDEVEAKEGESQQQIQQYVEGIPLVQAYKASDWFLSRFRSQQESLQQSEAKLKITLSLSDNVSMAVFGLAQLAALFLIALSTARDSLSPGTVVASSLLFELVVWPVLGLSSQWSQMQASVGAFGRISTWLKLGEVDGNKKRHGQWNIQPSDDPAEPLLRLEQVSVTNETRGRNILDEFTLNVRQGEMVAVVGTSGSGKSTLCQVCAGLIEPTGGRALLHNTPVDQYIGIDDLPHLTYMSQIPNFFTGTIEENIRLTTEAALPGVRLAAERAALHEFIDAQEGQYDAPLQEKGSNLSGGQQQRLALARIFMRISDLYILDEPTASLDIQTEQKVMSNLLSFMEGRTALIVTHRIEVARQCSRIIVMEAGRLVEDGTHEQLMEKRGIYYHMNMREEF
ncbi:ABC transporter ATP-binding protein [Paenibacillus pabuli]|uniref:ABC transporter ATP-binding protein n=1 Tax=Paenibacillus pabuli TaxID=1472 RepID=UPI003CEA22E7